MGRRAAHGFRIVWKRGWAYVRFTHEGTDHRVALGTRDPREAAERAPTEYAETVSGRRRTLVVDGRPRASGSSLPLEQLLAKWIASCAGVLDEETCSTLETYARHYLGFFGALDRVTEPSIGDYVRARLRKVLRSTVQKERSFLAAFLAWCVEHGALDRAPVVPPPPPKAAGVRAGPQRARPVEITEDQARSIVAALPKASKAIGGRRWPIRARYLVAWETGLRPATMARLEVGLHYSRGAVELLLDDADDKARFGRALPLSGLAREALDAVLPEKGLIFGDHRFDKALKAAAAKVLGADTARRFAQYDFRHGRATHLLDEGASLTGTAFLLGHKRTSTTDKYLRPSRRAAERALAAVGAPLPPPGERELDLVPEKPWDPEGDRRVSNPRQLEPQRSANDENARDRSGGEGPVEHRRATSGQDCRPGGGFVDAARLALAEAFEGVGAWQRALEAALSGDEEATLAELARLARRSS